NPERARGRVRRVGIPVALLGPERVEAAVLVPPSALLQEEPRVCAGVPDGVPRDLLCDLRLPGRLRKDLFTSDVDEGASRTGGHGTRMRLGGGAGVGDLLGDLP